MTASFEEKSVWIQLASVVLGLGVYFVFAARLLWAGVVELPAYVPLFAVAVVMMVILLAGGHLAAALASRPEGRDERDRLIEWKAEARSSWLLAAGVLGAVVAMISGLEHVWVAHLLLLTLAFSEVLGSSLRLVYYRRGV